MSRPANEPIKKIGSIVRMIITDMNELASFALDVSVPIKTQSDVNRKYDMRSKIPYSTTRIGSRFSEILNGMALYFWAMKYAIMSGTINMVN